MNDKEAEKMLNEIIDVIDKYDGESLESFSKINIFAMPHGSCIVIKDMKNKVTCAVNDEGDGINGVTILAYQDDFRYVTYDLVTKTVVQNSKLKLSKGDYLD